MRLGVMITLSLVTTSSALAFGQFDSEVPNGSEVSCAGCHERIGGGAPWNAFGDALFVANGGTADNAGSIDAFADSFVWWNEAICNADSDGDGQTNGEELGDPDCVWSGGAPARTTDISNPGSAQSTSTNARGGAGGGEGEGEDGGDGEGGGGGGDGNVEAAGGCRSAPASTGLLALVPLAVLRRRRR